MPDIYPYNYWILYAAIAALILTIIISLVQIARKAKEMMNFLQPRTAKLERNMKLMQIKMEAMNEKKAENAKKNKYIALALPVLLAVYQQYSKDDEAKGIDGVIKSARTVMNNRNAESKLIKKVAAAIR